MSRRDSTSSFDPKMYYSLSNPSLSGSALSFGPVNGTAKPVVMTDFKKFGTENWQLFFQSGRYFIRNRDYGAGWQLGFTGAEVKPSVPKLYPRNGSISQQWTIDQVAGGWRLGNVLMGADMVFALPNGWAVPAMRSANDTDGGLWNIGQNTNAAKTVPLEGESLSNVDGFEASPSTSLASASSSAASSSSSTSTPASTSSSSGLSTGAKAGIGIGAAALFILIVALLSFVLVKRRRSRRAPETSYAVQDHKFAFRGELAAPHAELASGQTETTHDRAELYSESMERR